METETIQEAPKILGTAKLLGRELITKYDHRECEAMVRILVEFVIQKPYKWLLMNPDAVFTSEDFFVWEASAARLLAGEPIQYITGSAWFFGLEFRVNHHVLIPRPETEELVQLILECTDQQSFMNIIDVGTGSGCIALALAHALPHAAVAALDVSEEALEMARANAERLNIPCVFHNCDVLAAKYFDFFSVDILVSNPPYIPRQEYLQLAPHVLLHEPALALEVPDDDPLAYYKKVSEMGRSWLKPGGWLFFEIHEDFGQEMLALMGQQGYELVTLKQDMSGRDRMISGKNPA